MSRERWGRGEVPLNAYRLALRVLVQERQNYPLGVPVADCDSGWRALLLGSFGTRVQDHPMTFRRQILNTASHATMDILGAGIELTPKALSERLITYRQWSHEALEHAKLDATWQNAVCVEGYANED